ncbi:MAG: hypothetical protein H7145_23510 [Akkermansiaceae bacterium]|nr:hypothetical protein [Armatimonadota bacterium]
MTVRSILGTVAGAAMLLTLSVGVAHAGTLRWTGEVDDTAIIRLDGRDLRANGNMRGIRNARFDVDGALPNRPVRVRLAKEGGRGDVEIIEQPSSRNNYTAVVRIRDSQAGSSRYGFVLQWDNGRDDRRDDRNRNNRRDRGDDRRDNRWDDDWNRGRRP